MSAKPKKSNNSTELKPATRVGKGVGNYENHPFFLKKAASAKALLLKAGLPKQLTGKADR